MTRYSSGSRSRGSNLQRLFTTCSRRAMIRQDSIGHFQRPARIEMIRTTGRRPPFRDQQHRQKHLSGTLWTSAIIQEVWSHWQLVCTQRNNAIHGQDETSRSAALRRRAEIILHEIYSRKDFMKPSDRDKILFDDIEHHLAKTTNQIMNWISVHKPLISHSIKETDRLSIRGVSSIRIYFPAQPP